MEKKNDLSSGFSSHEHQLHHQLPEEERGKLAVLKYYKMGGSKVLQKPQISQLHHQLPEEERGPPN